MTEPTSIYPAYYLRGISALLRRVGLPTCEVLLVPSVQEWARSVGLDGPHPHTAGMAATRDGLPIITLCDTITEGIRDGIVPLMELRGFGSDLNRIEDPAAFLEHLVLHEAAHLLLPDGATDSACDTWAFERLSGCLQPDASDGAT